MPTPGPDESKDDFVERCIPIVIEDGTAEDGEQAVAVCSSMWDQHHDMSETQDFLFVDLQDALTEGAPFVGFAPGEFVDMRGKVVEIDPDDVDDVLDRTLQAIEEHQERGMDGLPIDAEKHDKGKAAGWITGAELGEIDTKAGETLPVIRLIAKWTKLGAELIGDRIMTNFSPTIDLENKRIVGGSLTNWPASVDENGTPLFHAIELSQGVHYLEEAEQERDEAGEDEPEIESEGDKPMGDNDKDTQPDRAELEQQLREELAEELTPQIRQQVIAELAPGDEEDPEEALARLRESLNLEAFADVADLSQARDAMLNQMQDALKAEYDRMQKQAGSMLADMMQQIKRDQHIAELAERWSSGTEQTPRGLPVGREELETFLADLSDRNRKAAESILGRIWEDGLTEFSELGHGRRVEQQREVPDYAREAIRKAVANGADLDEVFSAAGLGEANEYDLSEFKESDNG